MSEIPCKQTPGLKKKIDDFAEVLKTQAHLLGDHGLDEEEFYQTGVFRGAIERIRGQFSAAMSEKRDFVKRVLNHMEDNQFIRDWASAGSKNRHDYSITMPSGKIAVIELKGCLDGNNTTIFTRPPQAQEFIVWSICTNRGSDPRKNTWSGVHTRLSAEIVDKKLIVDGLMIWDWLCGTIARPCPKIDGAQSNRFTVVGPHKLPPPCIYMFPATYPSPRNNPSPSAQMLESVEILDAFHRCFGGDERELNYVTFDVAHEGAETTRKTKIVRDGITQKESEATDIKRS